MINIFEVQFILRLSNNTILRLLEKGVLKSKDNIICLDSVYEYKKSIECNEYIISEFLDID